jgi:hypothetical protein
VKSSKIAVIFLLFCTLFFIVCTGIGLYAAFLLPLAFCIALPVYLSGVVCIIGYFSAAKVEIGWSEAAMSLWSWAYVMAHFIALRNFRF